MPGEIAAEELRTEKLPPTGKVKRWQDLEKDEAVDMAQFEGRKMVEVSEKKENGVLYTRATYAVA